VADLHHLRLARQIEIEDRTELRGQAERMRLAETVAAASADSVITHSSYEAEILRKNVSAKRVHTIPWDARTRPTPIQFAKRHGVAFIGGFAHQPNCDAARWLIGEIMPLVRKRHADITCALVGSELPPDIAALCGSGVTAVGRVKNLMDIFDRVRLTVAPLGYGAGVKGKVIDSLAAGVPCVCTPVAAEGLDWPDPLRACVADGAERIADAIVRLHEDESFNQSCRTAGLDFIERRWSARNVDALMHQALGISSRGNLP
jgi:glycosyltransferase involved in cell wall biosynthesis